MDTITNASDAPRRPQSNRSSAAPFPWFRRKWVSLFSTARYDRLEGDLKVADAEIRRRVAVEPGVPAALIGRVADAERLPGPGAPEPASAEWTDAALAILAEARGALADGKIDLGWKLLHAARRIEIFGLDRGTELPAYVEVLRKEADKLNAWRRKAVQALLGASPGQDPVTPAVAWRAASLRDEHYSNQSYKDQLARTQILVLSLILAATMATLLALIGWNRLPLGAAAAPLAFFTFAGVTLFGILGGTVSAMLQASNTAESSRIPSITAATRVTLMRILMGGASALLVFFALASQLTGIFSEAVAGTLSNLTPQTAYVLAFIAGFSERLVLRAVEHVAGTQQPPPPAAAGGQAQRSS